MNLGEKLRQFRRERNLTQPDLAEAMGIEQSYLSKLENGKSLPSNDTLRRILDVLEIEIGEFVDSLDQGTRNQLRQLPDVAEHLRREKEMIMGNRRRWLVVSAALVAVGAGLIYAGWAHLFFPNIVYLYESHGVVLDGEPNDVFENRSLPVSSSSEELLRYQYALRLRRDVHSLRLYNYAGREFVQPVEGGSRTYYLRNEKEIDPWQNKAVTLAGVMLLVFGAIGLVIERKLNRQV